MSPWGTMIDENNPAVFKVSSENRFLHLRP